MKKLNQMKWLDLEQKILKSNKKGKNLIELTTYENLALWYFIRFRLYHSEETNRFAKILMRNSHLFLLIDSIYDFFTLTLCKVISTLLKTKICKKGPKIMLVAHNRHWKNELDQNGTLKKRDIFLNPILMELKRRNYSPITISPLKYSISAIRIMIERLKAENAVHTEINSFWSPEIWLKQVYASKYFRSVWKKLSKNNPEFVSKLMKEKLTYELEYYFNSFFGNIIKQIEITKKAMKKIQPDLILVTSEGSGIFENSLIVAGKMKKIPTLAVQHGHIGPLHQAYVYPKSSFSQSGSIQSPYLQIADKTAVYGPFHYNFLTEVSGYPKNAVVITGQPRYDKLANANKIFDKEKFCSEMGIDSKRKIVLVATQKVPEREEFIKNVLKGLRPFSNVQTIVKPHPSENNEFYKELITTEKNVLLLPKNYETLEAIYSCDLLVSMFSTVITEAALLGKPAVTIKTSGDDPAPFYDKVTLRVNLEHDFTAVFQKALFNDKVRENLRQLEEHFAFDHAYIQDGKATSRVVDLIDQLIEK